jgi:hypothetical protein
LSQQDLYRTSCLCEPTYNIFVIERTCTGDNDDNVYLLQRTYPAEYCSESSVFLVIGTHVQQSTAGRLSASLVCSCALKIAVHAMPVKGSKASFEPRPKFTRSLKLKIAVLHNAAKHTLILAAAAPAAQVLVYRKGDNALLSNYYHLDRTQVYMHRRYVEHCNL